VAEPVKVAKDGHMIVSPSAALSGLAVETTKVLAMTHAFSRALTPKDTARVLVEVLESVLGAFSSCVSLLNREGTVLELVGAAGDINAELADLIEVVTGRMPIDAELPMAEAVREGRIVWISTAAAARQRYPRLEELQRRMPFASVGAVPVVFEDRIIGSVGLSAAIDRELSPDELHFLVALGQQCGLAFERTRLYQAAEDARRQAEDASRTKDEFLATVSHELRTPINSILGWAHLLRSGQLDGAGQARALETIERSARQQAQLIEELLDVSRIVSGKLALHTGRVDLAKVIGAALDTVRPAALAKRIDVTSHLDDSARTISGDADRLQQVVWNLVSNAIKFTGVGGRVSVRLERAGTQVHLQVTDDGQGIARERLPHVFERFWQGDGTNTRAHSGLGLGLAIARNLVEMHGGTIHAQSAGEGQGATFIVGLPIPAVTEVHLDKAEVRPQPLRGVTALVVDDEPDARDLVSLVLEHHGAHVEAVGSAAEALARLPDLRPDVLVSDIGLPGVNGYELIERARALDPEQGGFVPALALTAYASVDDMRRAMRAGFQMHVPKPVEPERLVRVVAELARWR
jgi:signal transduction histidine kinase